MTTAVDINSTQIKVIPNTVADNNINKNELNQKSNCPCSPAQLLAIFITIGLVALFASIFVPIYVKTHDDDDKVKYIYIEKNETQTIPIQTQTLFKHK